MSYILDALKKSEQERSRGAIPDIKNFHHPNAVERVKPVVWPYIILVILLLNAAVFGVWIYRQQNEGVAIDGDRVTEITSNAAQRKSNETDAPQQELSSVNGAEQTGQGNARRQDQLAQNLSALREEAQKNNTSDRVTPPVPVKEAPLKAADTTSKEPPPRKNVVFSDEPLTVSNKELQNAEKVESYAALADVQIVPDKQSQEPRVDQGSGEGEILEDKIYDIAELPESVKRDLPAISFAGHVYSSTVSQRSVMMNGKKMREGEEVSKGLMLEQITLDGVVLRSQGYRFKLGALQDWSFQ